MSHQIFKIKCLVDKDRKRMSYIAQSRAVYKIIYSHPPDAAFDEEKFKSIQFIGVLMWQNSVRNFLSSPLERILIWHQDLHSGRKSMDESKIKELLQDYMKRLILSLKVKMYNFNFI